jgi:hypothetical protein
MKPIPGLVFVGAIAASLLAVFFFLLKPLSTGAREEFVRAHSCPADRVSVVAKPDVRWSELFPRTRPEPSEEVRADPSRYAQWRRDQAAADDEAREALSGVEVFEVSGCGHLEWIGCWRPGNGEGDIEPDQTSCTISTRGPNRGAPR